jgi:hypothetical protein
MSAFSAFSSILSLMDINGTPGVAFETGVEEARRVVQRGARPWRPLSPWRITRPQATRQSKTHSIYSDSPELKKNPEDQLYKKVLQLIDTGMNPWISVNAGKLTQPSGLHGRVLLGMIVTGAFIATNSYKSFLHRDIERLILAAAKGGSRDT